MTMRRSWAWVAMGVVALWGCDSRSSANPRRAPAPEARRPPTPPAAQPTPTHRAARSKPVLDHLEVLTGGAARGERLPVIVAMHGLGDRPESFARLFDGFDSKARVLVPRAPRPWGDGHSWFAFERGNVEKTAKGIAAAADRVVEWLTPIAAAGNVRGRPIVTGFSQGGMLSFAIAVRHPGTIAAAIPVGGWLPPPLWPAEKPEAPLPTIVALHGTADTRVPLAPTEAAVDHLESLGFTVQLERYAGVGHSIPPPVRTDLFAALARASQP